MRRPVGGHGQASFAADLHGSSDAGASRSLELHSMDLERLVESETTQSALRRHREHGPEPHPVLHHLLKSLLGLIELKDLDARPHAGEGAESHRIFRVD
jgi:hypothetical protein